MNKDLLMKTKEKNDEMKWQKTINILRKYWPQAIENT